MASEDLKGLVVLMGEEIKSLTLKVEDLQGQLAVHRKARFGLRSERRDQLAFDLQKDAGIAQAAEAQHDETGPNDDAPQSGMPAKRQHSRAPLPDHLERQTEVLFPGDACASCGGALRPLGEDVTQELEYIPGRFLVRQIVRPRMACKCCETFAQAPLPSRPIGRGRAGPGFSRMCWLTSIAITSRYIASRRSTRARSSTCPGRRSPTGVKTGRLGWNDPPDHSKG